MIYSISAIDAWMLLSSFPDRAVRLDTCFDTGSRNREWRVVPPMPLAAIPVGAALTAQPGALLLSTMERVWMRNDFPIPP
jgi:hypothetical protein